MLKEGSSTLYNRRRWKGGGGETETHGRKEGFAPSSFLPPPVGLRKTPAVGIRPPPALQYSTVQDNLEGTSVQRAHALLHVPQ